MVVNCAYMQGAHEQILLKNLRTMSNTKVFATEDWWTIMTAYIDTYLLIWIKNNISLLKQAP